MAQLGAEGDELRLRLRTAEKLCSFHGDVRVPLRTVRSVRVAPDGWGELRGWRSTGVAVPGWMARGRRRHGSGWDVTEVRGEGPVVVVELNGAIYQRLVVTVDDPAATAARVADAAGIRLTPPGTGGAAPGTGRPAPGTGGPAAGEDRPPA